MKKILSTAAFLLISLLVMSSCEKEEPYHLVGTMWTTTCDGTKYALKFSSENVCQLADNRTSSVIAANYTQRGNTIKFKKDELFFMTASFGTTTVVDTYYFIDAKISGNAIILKTKCIRTFPPRA